MRSFHPSPGRRALAICASATALIIAGCGSDNGSGDGNSATIAATPQVRAVHASADTGAVDIIVNGSPAFRGVTFGQASSAATLPAGTARLQVNPAGLASSALDLSVPLAAGRQYVAIAIGKSAAGTPADKALAAVLIDDEGNAPQSGNVKLRVVHGAPDVPAIDIYVTAATAALPTTPTIAGLAYKASAPGSGTRALEIGAGSYRVRATPAGQREVVFDSGTLALAAGADLLLIALPAAGTASPVALLAVPHGANAFNGADQRAQVRAGHFAPDVPTVDVYLRSPGAALNAGNLVAPDVSFAGASNFQAVEPGSYRASVALDTQSTEAIGLDANLTARQNVNVFAIGLAGGTGAQALRLQAYAEDLNAPAAGRAKLRVIHLAPDAPAVDVVVLDANGAIAARIVTNLGFPDANASALDLAPGIYRVAVVPTGAATPLLPAATQGSLRAGVDLTLAAGDIVTALAIGCLNTASGPCTGGRPFRIVALDSN